MRIHIAAGMLAISTATMAAQTQSSQPKAGTAQPPAKPVTVTGCLQAAPDQRTFTLTTSDKSGASNAAKGGKVKTISYTLLPQANVDLKSHVGHTVQVTGAEPQTPDADVATTAHDTATGTAGTTGQQKVQPKVETTAKTEIVAKRLSVSSVKQIAADCRVAR